VAFKEERRLAMRAAIVFLAVLLISGCGADPGGSLADGGGEEQDWFAEYYADCVEACGLYNEAMVTCGKVPVEDCVRLQWDHGSTNEECRGWRNEATGDMWGVECWRAVLQRLAYGEYDCAKLEQPCDGCVPNVTGCAL